MEGEQFDEQTLTPELAAAQSQMGYLSARSGASQREAALQPQFGALSHSQSREQLRPAAGPGAGVGTTQKQAFPGAPGVPASQQQMQPRTSAAGALDSRSRIPLVQPGTGITPASMGAGGGLGARADQHTPQSQRPGVSNAGYVGSVNQQSQLRSGLNEPVRSTGYSQARPPGEPQLYSAVVPRMSEAVRPELQRPGAGPQQLQRNAPGATGATGAGAAGRRSGLQQLGAGAGARTLAVTSVGAFTEPDSLDSPGPDTARARAVQSQLLHDPSLFDPNLLMQQQPQLYAYVQPTGETLALNGYPEVEPDAGNEDGHYSPLPSDFERPASQILRPTAPVPSQQLAAKQAARQPQAPASRQQQQQQQQQPVSRSAAAFAPSSSSQPSQALMRSAAAPAPAPAPAQVPPASNRLGSGAGAGASGAASAKRSGTAPFATSSTAAQWLQQQQQSAFDLDSGLVGSESLASGRPETEQHYASTRIVPLQPSAVPPPSNQRYPLCTCVSHTQVQCRSF